VAPDRVSTLWSRGKILALAGNWTTPSAPTSLSHFTITVTIIMIKKSKAVPVKGLQGCETLRIPHWLYNWLIDRVRLSALLSGRVFSSGTHFCYRLSKPQGAVRLEGLGKSQTFDYFIGLEPETFKLVQQTINRYATARPNNKNNNYDNNNTNEVLVSRFSTYFAIIFF
jgi:hypothetical protein